MAEILVKAIDATHPDPALDLQGCFKAGMPIDVREDGFQWGNKECLPLCVVIKIPTIPADTVRKYISDHSVLTYIGLMDDGVTPNMQMQPVRPRLWQIQVSSLPQAARNKLANTGVLTIKAGSYSGAFDYTWAQVKNFFMNLKTNQAEAVDI